MMMLTTTAYMSERFNRDNILILEEMGYEVHVVANFDKGNPTTKEVLDSFRKWVEEHHGKCFSIAVTNKPTDQKSFRKAYHQCLDLIEKYHYDFIHCHTPVAGVLGRLVAHKTHTKVIYTAHGFHFYKGAPLKNWLLYYPVEKKMSDYTDLLITINHEDYDLAKKKFHANKTEYVPGVGVDLSKFDSGRIDVEEKRRQLGLRENDIFLLSVGELSDRKNHIAVIEALGSIYQKTPNAHIEYVIAGEGANHDMLETRTRELGIENHLHLLGYRTDISDLCQAADLFVFPSKQEGLPVALMEAIACKTPVLCSDIRGNNDLVSLPECLFDVDGSPERPDSVAARLSDAVAGGRDAIKKSYSDAVQQNYSNLRQFDLIQVDQEMQQLYGFAQNGGAYRELNAVISRYRFECENDIPHNAFTILSVGELNANKNHQVVIRAIGLLIDTSIHYVIAGVGELKEELERMAASLGVDNQVHFVGYRTDIADLHHYVDCYALPSIREGLNVSLMEAMASGLPCIAGRIRGNVDLIDEGEGGHLVPASNIASWKSSIEELMKSTDRDSLGYHNASKIRPFSKTEVNKEMQNIYRSDLVRPI